MSSIKNIHLYLNFVFFGFKIAVFFRFNLICSSFFCIIALGSGQRLLYRLGSVLGLVLVLVLPYSVEANILNVSLYLLTYLFTYLLIYLLAGYLQVSC